MPGAPSTSRRQFVPPDERRRWTAEIGWSRTDEEPACRFVVTARGDGAHGIVAESDPLPWPPRGPEGLRALREAVAALEVALLAAGWAPLPAGRAWYSKRFAWTPADPATDGLAERWSCEITWQPRLLRPRFAAVVRGRDGIPRRPIGVSAPLSRIGVARPDPAIPEHHARLAALVQALEAAGWRRCGQGVDWYAERFEWTGARTPRGPQ